ncbi:MAG: 1-acyl-sn-glycerol-3-phosphate acyltransferase [Cryomorphaceae bacterium]|jgi:1-acyl-sn-glycerol-3-phosphate acyltransferase
MIHQIYYFLLQFIVKLAIKLFYRRIEIQGLENIPKNGPVLLAPNHQNAFIDALLPATLFPRRIHFLVRADVFKSNLARRFFSSIQMMPIYRQRDGIQNLAKNEETFRQCHEILRRGEVLLLFPEATHKGVRKLRPLSKGFTRILFGALEGYEDLDIKVVPLGLNYSNYSDSQSRVLMSYGKPISVQDYRVQIAENKARAMNSLREKVFEELAEEIIHIEDENAMKAFNVELERILPFYADASGSFSRRRSGNPFYKSREKALQQMDSANTYFRRIFIYDAEMEKRKLRAPFFYINKRDSGYWVIQNLFLLIFLPLFLISWVLHAPSYFMVKALIGKYVKDRQFYSSIKLVGMLVLFPLFSFIFSIVFGIFYGNPLLVIPLVLLFFPLSVFIIRELRLPYRYCLTFWRMNLIRWKNKDLYKYLNRIEEEVLENIDSHENHFRNEQSKQTS